MPMPYTSYTPMPGGYNPYAVYQQPAAAPGPPQPGYPQQYYQQQPQYAPAPAPAPAPGYPPQQVSAIYIYL